MQHWDQFRTVLHREELHRTVSATLRIRLLTGDAASGWPGKNQEFGTRSAPLRPRLLLLCASVRMFASIGHSQGVTAATGPSIKRWRGLTIEAFLPPGSEAALFRHHTHPPPSSFSFSGQGVKKEAEKGTSAAPTLRPPPAGRPPIQTHWRQSRNLAAARSAGARGNVFKFALVGSAGRGGKNTGEAQRRALASE